MNNILSNETAISKYEDELKFLIKDMNQLNDVYCFVKKQFKAITETEKNQIDIYLDDDDLTLHGSGVSFRIRQAVSDGKSECSLDLKKKHRSTDGNDSGIYRRREATKNISTEQKDALIGKALIQNVAPEFYNMLCDMLYVQSVSLSDKFEVNTNRRTMTVRVDSKTQINLNFDVITYDSSHTYFELEIKYSTSAQNTPKIIEKIRSKFKLMRWDKSKYDRGIYLYKKNIDRNKLFQREDMILKFNLSKEEIELFDKHIETLNKVYNDFVFHWPYLDREEGRIFSELKPLKQFHKEQKDEMVSKNFVHSIKPRIKDPDHLIAKIVRKGAKYFQDKVKVTNTIKETKLTPDNYMSIITDLIGVRVLHLFKDNWLEIDAQLTKMYGKSIVEKKFYVRKGDEIQGLDDLQKAVKERKFEFWEMKSGYRSAHYLIKRDVYVDSGDMLTMYVEIQVRTVFEEAWGEVDHEIRYPHYDNDITINHFLKTFNRIVGSADEMATYIKAYRDRDSLQSGGQKPKMNLEIERKYLLKALPDGLINGQEIRQGYLSTADPEVRVRQLGSRYFVTKKSSGGLSREESESEVTEQVFNNLWPATEGKRVEKIRYSITASDGTIWELDDYRGNLAGLFTAEVELPTEESVPLQPEILKDLVIADVTHDGKYKNKKLATQGLPSSV